MFQKKSLLLITLFILGGAALFSANVNANIVELKTVAMSEITYEDALVNAEKLKKGQTDDITITNVMLFLPLKRTTPAWRG